MKTISSEFIKDSFEEMEFAPQVLAALAKMQITVPTQIQKQSLPYVLTGNDLVTVAQTGSGKTLIYCLGIWTKLLNDPTSRALVLTPSRETADQIFSVFNTLLGDTTISRCLIVAGQPDKPQVSQLKKNPRIIVATPGRLLEHLANNKLLLQKLSILVIDEADRMLESGFSPQLKQIRSTLRGQFQTLFFGASFGEKTETFAKDFLKPDGAMIRAEGAEKPVTSLKQVVVFTKRTQKKELLVEVLKSGGRAIVFVNDQPNCEIVYEHLGANGIEVDVIHGGLVHGHRARVIREFREERFDVLVTTDLLARGLDVPNIDLVVNYDLPYEVDDFLHRIGRTARAGKDGTAVTFVCDDEEKILKQMRAYLKNAENKTFDVTTGLRDR